MFHATAEPAAVSAGPCRSFTHVQTLVEKFIGMAGSSSVQRFIICVRIGPRSLRASVAVRVAARRSYSASDQPPRLPPVQRFSGRGISDVVKSYAPFSPRKLLNRFRPANVARY